MFGHVRGALADADEDREGRLVEADGGTLFLDEVSEIPLPIQAKLLRALEHHEVVPVGGAAAGADRVSRDHGDEAAADRSGQRGAVSARSIVPAGGVSDRVAPLRDRREDIADLAAYFIESLSSGSNEQPARLTAQTLAELQRRPWHGNVRELRHAIEHALIVARGPAILPEHLPPSVPAAAAMQGAGDMEHEVALAVRRWAEQSIGEESLQGRVYDETAGDGRAAFAGDCIAQAPRAMRGRCAHAGYSPHDAAQEAHTARPRGRRRRRAIILEPGFLRQAAPARIHSVIIVRKLAGSCRENGKVLP